MDRKVKSARHLYGRGWFGLIPLIGGLIGPGLIQLGIFFALSGVPEKNTPWLMFAFHQPRELKRLC
jgi:hypothetical protein